MGKKAFTCSFCSVVQNDKNFKSKQKPKGSSEYTGWRSFKYSHWCKKCNNWKPKEMSWCECCGLRLRTKQRSQPNKDAKRM